jgi:hypothetical protein
MTARVQLGWVDPAELEAQAAAEAEAAAAAESGTDEAENVGEVRG